MRYAGLIVVVLAIASLALGEAAIWILGTMCVLAVVLPPKWNPAFWHKVHPGTGEIREGVEIKHPLGFD